MKTIYSNSGIRVVTTGSVCVVLPDGRVVDRYPMDRVNEAIELADEMASSIDQQQKAA